MTLRQMGLGLVVVMILIQLFGCSTNRVDFAELMGEGSEIRTYEVFGMDCPGCHGGLENIIDKIPGVRASRANWETHQLQVAMLPNAEVDDSAIYNAIKRANFTPGKRLR